MPEDDKNKLIASLSFGYGLIQVAFSIVPTALLKVCEMFGFQANRDIGLDALKISSHSTDMKAPIATLTLLWYHTVVRPFCALDGNNIERGALILLALFVYGRRGYSPDTIVSIMNVLPRDTSQLVDTIVVRVLLFSVLKVKFQSLAASCQKVEKFQG